MANIHIILQGKGGVGKSFVAALMAQFLKHKGTKPVCIDTDPVNATFSGFVELNVNRLKIMENDEINTRFFDELIEKIAKNTNDVVIDNGASSFVPLSHYMISNHVPYLLRDLGHTLIIHTVITGGQAQKDTINGFLQLIDQFPNEALFVVWLNPYWGTIEHDGKSFEQMKAYSSNKSKISAIVKIPQLKAETFGVDISEMLTEKLTFDEAISSDTKTIMTRHRLKIVRTELFNQMENSIGAIIQPVTT